MSITFPSAGPITSRWGPRLPLPFHHGWDFGFWSAHPDYRITAAAPGRVVRVFWTSTMGYCIEVDHGDGIHTRYCHLADRGLVNVGDEVTRGRHIGTMGSTGSAAVVDGIRQTHLHFEVLVDGIRVDPARYFSGTAGGDLTPITPDPRNGAQTVTATMILQEWKPAGKTPRYVVVEHGTGRVIPCPDFVDQFQANTFATALGVVSAVTAKDLAGFNTIVGWCKSFPGPVAVATAGASKADVDAAADRVIAKVPTAEQIAETVNTDAAQRMQS